MRIEQPTGVTRMLPLVRLRSLAAGLMAFLLSAAVHGAAVEDRAAEFALESFGALPPRASIAVTGEVAKVCSEIVGGDYAAKRITYYTDLKQSLWVLQAPGKHGLITAGYALSRGRIHEVRVLVDRERRGRAIRSSRYLRQYRGIGLGQQNRMTGRIDGITGATVSATAIEKMALLALRLDAIVRERTSEP